MTKVLERLQSEAGRAAREQASSRIASLSRVPTRDRSGTVRVTRTDEPKLNGEAKPKADKE